MRLLGALCAGAILLTLGAGRAAAWQCVKDIRDAGPDGRLCSGSTRPDGQDAAPAPVVAPAAAGLATGAAGLLGNVFGAGLVQPLPPMPKRAAIKPLEDENEKPEDPSVKNGVQTARDILKDYSGPLIGADGVIARSKALPAPASQAQVDATVSELQPLLTHERKKDAGKKNCRSRCWCRGSCTPTCEGTCYKLGGKDADPDGKGIDCSGLVGQENPCFWYNKCDYTSRDAINAAQEHRLLRHPGKDWPDLDDIDQAKDLRAGDVAFFNKPIADGKGGYKVKKDDHVVQIVGNPVCEGGVCVMQAVHAPHAGAAVERTTFAVDKNGNVSKLLTDADGRSRWVTTDLAFNGGGTPPPNTGKTRTAAGGKR